MRYVDEIVNTIICDRAENVIDRIEDESIDLIFTSPPFNRGKNYNKYDDNLDNYEYIEWLVDVFSSMERILVKGGRLAINISPLYSEFFPIHIILLYEIMNNSNLRFRNEIIWNKNNYNCAYTTWGSWKKPSAPYLKTTWEYIYVLYKGTPKKAKKDGISDLTADEFKKWTSAMWNIVPETRQKQFGHPAMFPEELAKRVIKLFSWVDDIILDPFNGAGTTTKVAKDLNRRYIGVDIDEKYCEIARRRLI